MVAVCYTSVFSCDLLYLVSLGIDYRGPKAWDRKLSCDILQFTLETNLIQFFESEKNAMKQSVSLSGNPHSCI